MDGAMFDRLTQVMSDGSRRNALRTALGGAAVATAGMVASGIGSDAKKKCKKCKKCKPRAVGAACESNRDCCPNETNRICALRVTTEPQCCGVSQARCSSDDDCCRGYGCGSTGRCLQFI